MPSGPAAVLRRTAQPRPVRVIAITSGKGGVGKTSVSVNLCVALADAGKRVMLLDADLGLANVDVLLGLRPQRNLADVLDGRYTLEQIILPGPSGVLVVPAASGVKRLSELTVAEHAGLIRAFSELDCDLDFLVIDTAAGINESVTCFSRAAHEVVVVVCDEPASITDAYGLIKVLNTEYDVSYVRLLANQVDSAQQGRELFNKMVGVTDRYLDVTLEFAGVVPRDEYLRKAVRKQRPVVQAYPRSRSSMAFKTLALKTDTWPVPRAASGHLEFFVERLIQSRKGHMEMPA
jgi:flagellar biosynthesis protein FlhG